MTDWDRDWAGPQDWYLPSEWERLGHKKTCWAQKEGQGMIHYAPCQLQAPWAEPDDEVLSGPILTGASGG